MPALSSQSLTRLRTKVKACSLPHRVISALLILLQGATAFTAPLACAAVSSAAQIPLEKPAEAKFTTEPSRKVIPNRTRPKSAEPRLKPVFSNEPTEEEIFAAALLEEPLVPVGSKPTQAENRALARALTAFAERKDAEDFGSLLGFLETRKKSPWGPAILLNLGLLYYHSCRFSETFPVLEEAWRMGRDVTDPRAKALVDRAVAELAKMNARVGRLDRLEALMSEIGNRQFTGPASVIIAEAREAQWRMKNEPGGSFRCGPYALGQIQAAQDSTIRLPDVLLQARSATNGFSLAEVENLAKKAGLKLQKARRSAGASIPLPAVVHWKVGHYAALLKQDNNRYLVRDPTFGPELWIGKDALESETSGYFLVRDEPLPSGWQAVANTEAEKVFGKGDVSSSQPGQPQAPPPDSDPTPSDSNASPGESCPSSSPAAMTIPSFDKSSVSLFLTDTPVGYAPPRGPQIRFRVTYLHREASQPSSFNFSNFGPKWTFNWISYVTDDPSNPSATASIYLPGGGADYFTGFNPADGTYAIQRDKRTVLKRTSSDSYSLSFPDGSQYLFERPTGLAYPRRVFLTRMIDSRGNAVTLSYDADNRLSGVTDSIGQVSTFSYEFPADPYKITKITDPFGRFASFGYDITGRLTSIIDVIGITSAFTYAGDFVDTLTTPYGVSHFRTGAQGTTRWLELTDPEGGTERVEFRNSAPGIPFRERQVPVGINAFNEWIWSRNTFYWDKKAFREAAGDYTKARIYHWLHGESITIWTPILESEKQPLEGRVWYNYPNQSWGSGVNQGMIGKPSRIGRVLDDGSTQLYQYEYNDLGNITKYVDPVGRTTVYKYAPNLVDLVEVRQTAGVDDVLETRIWNSQHLPLTITDGSGNTTTYTYNAFGQVLTVTNPLNETTTYNYDSNGYLVSVDPGLPGSADSATYTHDEYGRLRTATDSEGYTLTYDFDALDRLTRTTYPDTTYVENTYILLDRAAFTDRMGRRTKYTYDVNRHISSVEDPLHRTTRYEWCSCGHLEALTDPMGRMTRWARDVQGRVISKLHVDGSQIHYAYGPNSGLLMSIDDPKGQTKRYRYNPDNRLSRIDYLNPEHATPNVMLSYDGRYDRLISISDGTGLTTYSYHKNKTNGYSQVASVDGPFPSDTITYTYDRLGRVASLFVGGVGQAWNYDQLGRITTATNALGIFSNGYAGASRRVLKRILPEGHQSHYSYFDGITDLRLREIHSKDINEITISRFNYTYDRGGRVTSWIQQFESSPPEEWACFYDAGGRLNSVRISENGVQKHRHDYVYDSADNRIREIVDTVSTRFNFNPLNELSGTDEAKVNPATYEWDAENRLIAVNMGDKSSKVDYDALGRPIRAQTSTAGIVISSTIYVWAGDTLLEARDSSGTTVLERFFWEGQQISAENFLFTRDHLGSVRDVIKSHTGELVQYRYSPFGIRKQVMGSFKTAAGFAGYLTLLSDELLMTRFRVYSPSLARWLSRDPLGETAGYNLYTYVSQDPVNRNDPLGLMDCVPTISPAGVPPSPPTSAIFIYSII